MFVKTPWMRNIFLCRFECATDFCAALNLDKGHRSGIDSCSRREVEDGMVIAYCRGGAVQRSNRDEDLGTGAADPANIVF
jgi:hypothetical protein